MLACIICGQNMPYKWIYQIKSYEIPNNKYFPDNAVLITELDNTIHAVCKTDIVETDIQKAEKSFYGRYKIKNEYIKGVLT